MVIRMILGLALAVGVAAAQDAAVDNRAVVEMVEKGVAPELIVEAIRSAPEARFRFTPDDYAEFTRVKLGPAILKAMYDRQQSGAVRPAAASQARSQAASQTPSRTSRTAAPAALSPHPELARVEEYLSAGTNELVVSGSVTTPHGYPAATLGDITAGYQRYLSKWFSAGPSTQVTFIGTQARLVSLLGNGQFSPRLGERVYLIAGAGAGFNYVSALGFSNTGFLMNAYAGPRFFVSRNVAFDVQYRLQWRRVEGLGFKNASASGVNFGLAFVF